MKSKVPAKEGRKGGAEQHESPWRGFAGRGAELSSAAWSRLLTQPRAAAVGVQLQFLKPIKEKCAVLGGLGRACSASPESADSDQDLRGCHLKAPTDPLGVKDRK